MSEWSHYQQQNSISFQQTKSSSVQKRQTKLKEKQFSNFTVDVYSFFLDPDKFLQQLVAVGY